ncbi:ABC-type amino acid transport/signal transduction systems, periplasmic component/domain [Hahella chejuensis KCTC 2396]|uniref:ABC-type amino acid transport/signal transduction systems, periplasmic component/domain n=1 Tax=Hahella chejuensis (strain KCTC 2396) TaxID=349521 RepID=Q2S7Y2_HAHCH|nr:transporter substrate-binding domain-containing protein [Hahella chejuensis]ABC33242.1 ABC-type amino acid transport/signal transduction systems, periplasmic component/domain [Hahella chejuensis KCTC 2396]
MKILTAALTALCMGAATLASAEDKLVFNTQDFRPFTYLEKGEVAGPGTELVKLICKASEIQCEFNLLDWTVAQQQAKEKQVDGLYVIGWNEQRSEWLHYSLPILKTSYGFFVSESDTRQYSTLYNFSEHQVGVFGPSNTSKTLETIGTAMPTMKIVLAKDDLVSFRMLSDKKVDSVYSNRDVGFEILRQLGLKDIRFAWNHKSINYYVGFVKGHTSRKVINKFNKTLRQLYKDGEAQKVLDKYQLESSM